MKNLRGWFGNEDEPVAKNILQAREQFGNSPGSVIRQPVYKLGREAGIL